MAARAADHRDLLIAKGLIKGDDKKPDKKPDDDDDPDKDPDEVSLLFLK